ncbi:oligosaccharide flippase family protein, partial [bacterium]|nr:oligosaccharide flippase family protein [bacterium]
MMSSLSPRLMDNTFALMLTTALSGIVRLGSNLILSRLLYPEAFAIVGLIVSVFFVLELSSDMGFHAYIVRHKEGNKADLLDTLWSIRLLRGVILAAIMMLASWPLAQYFDSAALQPVFFVSAFVLLIQALHPLSDIVSDRQNRVAKPLYLELLAYSLSTIVVISVAFVSRSHWALVGGLFLQALF